MITVYVVSFEPDPEQGGVGGFNWFYDAEQASAHFETASRTKGDDSGIVWRLWTHWTDATDPVKITDEIDALWREGWPPEGTEVQREYVS